MKFIEIIWFASFQQSWFDSLSVCLFACLCVHELMRWNKIDVAKRKYYTQAFVLLYYKNQLIQENFYNIWKWGSWWSGRTICVVILQLIFFWRGMKLANTKCGWEIKYTESYVWWWWLSSLLLIIITQWPCGVVYFKHHLHTNSNKTTTTYYDTIISSKMMLNTTLQRSSLTICLNFFVLFLTLFAVHQNDLNEFALWNEYEVRGMWGCVCEKIEHYLFSFLRWVQCIRIALAFHVIMSQSAVFNWVLHTNYTL